jgi:hypothetical protein
MYWTFWQECVDISSAPPFFCDFPGIFEGGTDELGRRGGSFDGIDGKCREGAPSDGSDGGMMGRRGSIGVSKMPNIGGYRHQIIRHICAVS